jgi:hypothetical protein
MRLAAQIVLGVVLAGCSGLVSSAQPQVSTVKLPEVAFQLERPGLPVPRFTLRIREDGTGSYQAEEVQGPADEGALHYATGKPIDRTIALNPIAVARIFKAARELGRFNMVCASKAKNIADTGKKTLSYAGADGAGSCIYNYSDNKTVEMLTDRFLAIACTLDEGRRLEYLHRYDRLGLDAEMNSFKETVAAGHARELGTIAPVLTSIAADTAVIERVRLSAAKLLELAKDDSK